MVKFKASDERRFMGSVLSFKFHFYSIFIKDSNNKCVESGCYVVRKTYQQLTL